LPWLDSLGSDIVFGWRQLRKRPAVSAAAILSLALAIGATTAAFRLVNAVLLRTLPVADPQRLFFAVVTFVDRDGRADYRDAFDYATFRRYSETVADRADFDACRRRFPTAGAGVRHRRRGGEGVPAVCFRQSLPGFGVATGPRPPVHRRRRPRTGRTSASRAELRVLDTPVWPRPERPWCDLPQGKRHLYGDWCGAKGFYGNGTGFDPPP
jgi:hypothetical protein